MSISTLLFDVHRTLVDDSGFPRKYIWEFLKVSGALVDYPAYEKRYLDLVKNLFDWPSISPFITIREIHRNRLVLLYREFGITRDIETDLNFLWGKMRTSRIYPEVPEVMATIKNNYRCGLVSNADNDDPLLNILQSNGYAFDTIVTSEMVRTYKPNPAMLFQAMSQLGSLPQETLLIGDSPLSDILGAKNAGIQVVWLNRTGQKLSANYPRPEFEIQNLTQLLPVLKRLNNLKN